MTLSEARVSQAWASRVGVSTSGTMVKTWLMGAGVSRVAEAGADGAFDGSGEIR